MVALSVEDSDGLRCVDVIAHSDDTFGFREFRRDPEDGGRWTLVADYSGVRRPTKDEALREAARRIAWLAEKLQTRPE